MRVHDSTRGEKLKVCADPTCERKNYARGFCSRHYNKNRRHGKLDVLDLTIEDRFWPKVDTTGDCWVWTAAVNAAGYGRIGDASKQCGWSLAHRVSWEIANGPIPDGELVRHKCHNPPCVRPDHLELGSHRDNSRDTSRHGRVATQKLSDPEVLEIRLRAKSGESYKSLGREYEVTPRAIMLAATGATFRHLPMDAHPCPTCGRPWD